MSGWLRLVWASSRCSPAGERQQQYSSCGGAADPCLSRGLSQGEMPVMRVGPGLRSCFCARLCVGATETGVSCRNPKTDTGREEDCCRCNDSLEQPEHE